MFGSAGLIFPWIGATVLLFCWGILQGEPGNSLKSSPLSRWMSLSSDLRKTPPRSDALRHSGGDRRLWTSATVTLYLDVELSRDRRPGTEQNTSVGFDTMPSRDSFWKGRPSALPLGRVTGPGGGWEGRKKKNVGKLTSVQEQRKRGKDSGFAMEFVCIYTFLVYVHKL